MDESEKAEIDIAVVVFETRVALESAGMAARTLAQRQTAGLLKPEIELLAKLVAEAAEAFEALVKLLDQVVNLRRLQ